MPIPAAIGAALATAGANLIGTVVTNRRNKQAQEEAFAKNKQAVQEQNQYNSPVQQVARLKAAGLNPALAYGGDGQVVGSQTDVPTAVAPEYSAPQFSGIPESIISAQNLKISQNLADAEVKYKEAATRAKLLDGDLTVQEVRRYMIENDLLPDKITAEIDNIIADTSLKEQQKSASEQEQVRLNERQKYELEKLSAEAHLSLTTANAIIAKLPSEIALNNARASESRAAASYSMNKIEVDNAYVAQGAAKVLQDDKWLNYKAQELGISRQELDLQYKQYQEDVRHNMRGEELTNKYINTQIWKVIVDAAGTAAELGLSFVNPGRTIVKGFR